MNPSFQVDCDVAIAFPQHFSPYCVLARTEKANNSADLHVSLPRGAFNCLCEGPESSTTANMFSLSFGFVYRDAIMHDKGFIPILRQVAHPAIIAAGGLKHAAQCTAWISNTRQLARKVHLTECSCQCAVWNPGRTQAPREVHVDHLANSFPWRRWFVKRFPKIQRWIHN